jgi:hypothetical protein
MWPVIARIGGNLVIESWPPGDLLVAFPETTTRRARPGGSWARAAAAGRLSNPWLSNPWLSNPWLSNPWLSNPWQRDPWECAASRRPDPRYCTYREETSHG